MATQIIFFFSVFMVVYYYLFYPAIILLLALLIHRPIRRRDVFPEVTVLISAYNEERVIANKLRNTLDLDYPKDKFEIIVVSDCSTDRTDEIAQSFKGEGVKLISQMERRGKSSGLNLAIREAGGEILVFSDANAIYERQVLRNIVRNFFDESVGLVTGWTYYVSDNTRMESGSIGIYARIEKFLKQLESRVGSCVGADGAIFSVRRSLYKPLDEEEINDFVIPLQIVANGYRCIFDEEVVCLEEAEREVGGRFWRQVRITNRTLRAFFKQKNMMNPFRYPLFGFMLVSHKLMRFLTPFAMIFCFIANWLLVEAGFAYKVFLWLQFAFYGVGCWSFIKIKGRGCAEVSRIAVVLDFITVNLAILLGWFKYMGGEREVIWNSRRA